MQINPGGRLNTNDVVGRDNEIGKYWRVLERQGLRPPALEDVSSAVDTPVYDPHDPAKLNYYVTRLSSYYADDERSLALVVLDTMAGQASPTPVPELLNLCKHRDASLTDEQLREILTALAEDHYIEPTKCAGGAAYDFRWQLVKKWWKERRS